MTTDNVQRAKLKDIDMEKFVSATSSVYAKEIWNAAIEAAAIRSDELGDYTSGAEIRKLKK